MCFIRSIAITFAAIRGTSFLGSDLTDADFTQAVLKSTNFVANLTRTRFNNTRKLDQAKVGETYLKNPDVRQLVVTGEGKEKNFDHGNLRGVNLARANLVGANFIGADLSEANLQDVDLSRAKLVQTQLDATDFTGATLTGAFIEDWGITNQTKFNGVRCEYVFMRLPTKEDPEPWRKPDNKNEVFKDGEFGDFIKPIVDTLDLYHNQDVDPRAIAISFKQLAEKNPEAELSIAGMEVKGEDKFLLRAQTAREANKSELSAEYFEIYNQLKALAENQFQDLMAEKDSRIISLETMVNTALKKPKYYTSTQVEQVGIMTNNPGGFSVGGSVDGNINNVQGNNNRTIKADNNQGVIGDNNQVTQSQGTASTEEPLTKEQVTELLAELRGYLKSFLILNFAPLAPQFWGEQESICW
ncbi:pentapeptide repeat-containing protein [Moorena sp. SIO3B2]|uniref:pentapeptide repeat-containing protein n=1 Tax=Moorena sp. SIO3B2 TaxID=2607827 RepID=UPI0013C59F0E|nr:pentapeptide repeat-containing protein [Moorena sp. SIO3B2]